MAWIDVTHAVRDLMNQAAETSIPLVVRAVDYECWRCGQSATPSALIHPEGVTGPLATLDTTSGLRLAYAHELLADAESPIAETIKVRRSRSRGDAYLSNGCPNCDALFGEFPLQEDIAGVQANDQVATLAIIATSVRPLIEWWALTCDRNNLWWEE